MNVLHVGAKPRGVVHLALEENPRHLGWNAARSGRQQRIPVSFRRFMVNYRGPRVTTDIAKNTPATLLPEKKRWPPEERTYYDVLGSIRHWYTSSR